MTKDKYIGIDLGGTKILTAVADDNGEIIARVKLATETELGQERIKKNIFKSIYKVLEKTDIKIEKIKSIGIGSPGPLNVEKGIIYESANLPIKNMEIVELIEEETGVNTYLQNDANTAALGEKVFGAGKEADDLLYITISTGVGGGIIINGKIYYGHTGNAGEIGHMTVDPTGPQCGCGNYGCFEAVASGTAIAKRGRESLTTHEDSLIYEYSEGNPDLVDAPLIAAAGRKGDREALRIFKMTGLLLGVGIANVLNLFDPEIIVLGGGVMHAKDLFMDELKASLKERALKPNLKDFALKEAKLGKNTGVMGAVAVAMCDYLY